MSNHKINIDSWYTLTGWAQDDNRVDVEAYETDEGDRGLRLMAFPDDQHEAVISINHMQANDLRLWLNRMHVRGLI